MVDGLILVGVRRLVDRIELDQIGLRFDLQYPDTSIWRISSYGLHYVARGLRCVLWRGPAMSPNKGSRKRGRNPTWFHLMMSGIVLLLEVSCLMDSLVWFIEVRFCCSCLVQLHGSMVH